MSTATATAVPALKSILYATDFSQCSRAAMPYVRAMALRYGAAVHIVHVCASESHAAEAELLAEIAGTTLDEVPHTATVKRGDVWETLAGYAKEKNVDVIVLGTHGRRGFKKLMLGSVAEEVFRHAPCPVLTVGPHAFTEKAIDLSFANILFATDYSVSSMHALPYAISMAEMSHSRLMLLHVLSCSMDALPLTRESVSPGMQLGAEFMGHAIGYARQRLAEVISPQTMRSVRPELIVECGPVAETILTVARKREADLIVIGAHRGLSTHLPWAVASSVIGEAHCPVLTVRVHG